jgi:glycosyltransferase involved in cell wall biosynthesis
MPDAGKAIGFRIKVALSRMDYSMSDMSGSILIVTNMYPDVHDRAKGTFVRRIAQNLRQDVATCDVVAPSNAKGRLAKLRAYLRFYSETVRQMRARPEALIYVHYASHCAPPVLLARALQRSRQRLVVHTHGSDVLPEGNSASMFNRLKVVSARALLRRSDTVIVSSPYYRDVVLRMSGIDTSRIAVSPSGGVDLSVFHPTGEKPRRETLKLGFVGRLTEDKGTLDFLDMLGELRGQGVPVEGVVVGDGPQREAVDAASCAGMLTHVCFLEHPKLAEVYRDLDLLVFPTRRDSESLGLVGIEAMACGTAVVAYSGAGPETYIEDGVNGFLAPRNNWRRLAEIITCFAALGAEERVAIAARALERAQDFCARRTHEDLLTAIMAGTETGVGQLATDVQEPSEKT